jgi:hypothetical protein
VSGGRVPEFWYTLAIAPELRERHPELPLSLEEAAARAGLQREPLSLEEAVDRAGLQREPLSLEEAVDRAGLQREPEAQGETGAIAEAAPGAFLEAFPEPELEAEI